MNITIEEVTQQVVISGGDETTTVNISEEVVNVVQVGTQGPDGARGKSAYEVWLDEGNTGTETDFINFLAAGGDAAVLSVNAQIGEVVLDKSDVGLSNVDNTSDAAKPISTATQTALDTKASSTHTHTSSQVTDFDAEVDNNATVAANTAARHTHANQATLDATTASFTTAKDTKLTSISTGATANSSDATLLSRANHTGAQPISTVTGLQTALDAKQASGDYATNTALTTGLSGKASTSHAHVITDTTGLQTALDSKAAVSHTHTASQVTDFDTEVSNNVDVTANTTARHTHSNATVLNNTTASFTTADETKLDGIATGATANSSDATLLSRANHTGSQAQSTITNLSTDLGLKMNKRIITTTSTPTTAAAAAQTDYVYRVSGATTLTLPTAVGNTNQYTVVNVGTNTVTVATTSSQTINGSSSASMPIANMSLDLISDGANWSVT